MTRPNRFSVAIHLVAFVGTTLFPVEVAAIPSEDEPPSIRAAEISLRNNGIDILPIAVEPLGLPEIVVGESPYDRDKRIDNEKKAAKAAQDARRATPTIKKVPVDRSATIAIAREVFREFYPDSEWNAFVALVGKESNWDDKVVNKSSGACGIPQALPCSKLPQGVNTPVEVQIRWMLTYIKKRYQSPSNALRFHGINNWY